MDPVKSYLGRLLLEELTPVVMVLTTPHVEDACQKNRLNFIEMLLPFSLFKKIDVPVRTAADQPYRLQMFKLRLIYATDIQQKNYEAAEHHLKQVVSDSSEKTLPDLLSDPPQLETVLSKSESDLCPQWIQLFNKELIRTVSFSEHESFDHPVACLLVVSSKDEQPINRFVDLFNTDQLPSLLNDGVMDPKILKHYLLLHDNQDGAPENASRILAEMRSTFGPNDCRLLCINSAQGEDINREDISWLPYKPHGLHGHEIACSLNIDDLNGIKDFMQRLASNHIIPYMEQKIRVLNQQVSATRKGFRNQIKNLWWRKGKDDTPEAPHGPMYTFNSIESQIRVLGDYAFMLRDYELALSNYRLLSTDYKLDKSWKCYAGVQEMSGLSYFMLDQSRKESEYCMENALSTYLRIGSSCQRNATRCGLWWAEMLKARGQHKEASTVYFRISSEEPSLLAAVMLEQASCCYLLSNPPMLRKYGFHLILAGNRYYISDQRQHAIRAYRNALFVYKGNGWSYINDHVHFNIGRWYGLLGSFEVAVKHMLEVLACSQQSSVTQNIFLSDFFSVVQSMGKTFHVYRLQLPRINMSSLKVVYEDHRTYASASDVGVSESFWQVLEEEMVPPGSTIRTNWLESQPKSSLLKKYNDSCVCVAGEAVKVDLELTNPLQISISVSGISLICEISSSFEASDIDTSASSVAVKEDTGFENPSSCRDPNGENSLFTISKLDVVLGGGETKRVSSFDEICERHVLYKGVISTILAARKYYQFLVDVTSDGKRVYHSSFLDKVETCNDITDWFHSVVENAKKIQLEVTPKVEGILKLVGVRWTLSDSVVGFQYFELDTKKKKRKEKKGARQSLSSNLSLIVIKGIPKVEGYIDCMPTKAFAGDLRLVTLKLRNHSEYSVKNMKMKISHPRFLVPSSSPDLDLDFPRCLEKKGNLESKHVSANIKDVFKNLLFSFPKDAIIQGGAAFSWPLWFHAGLSGSISLYISLYYEIESCSSDMTYRTLRMRYNLEVLPSLDISFSVSPCSSRLQEYLVHMDILNRTSLESFVLHQLSCVSDQWTISTLPSCASICSTQTISAGQGLSCFFKLKDLRTSSSEKSNYTDKRSDVLIDSEGSKDLLIDVSGSPLTQFHHQERHHQGKLPKVYPGLLDFILISKKIESDSNPGPEANQQLFSNHACHCSITSKSPIWWLMEGPQTINHDFSDSHCEVNLHVTIYNCTGNIVSVGLATSDNIPETSQSSDTTQSPDYSSNGGWHDISLANDIKLMTTAQVSRPQKPALECTPPFFWSAASSTQLNVAPACTSKVPVSVCILAPGTYNLSNYELHWKLQPSEGGLADEEKIWSSGVGRGHPFYLTAVHDPR